MKHVPKIVPLQVKWYKGNRELSKRDYSMSYSDGVVSMEIIDCKPEDSGEYKCVATNKHGTDETNCVVIVESEQESAEQSQLAHNLLYSGGKLAYLMFGRLFCATSLIKVLNGFPYIFNS